MLYIFIIFLLFYCIVKYDINGASRNKWKVFNFLLFLFIIISALEFNVGSDDAQYRDTFNHLSMKNFKSDFLGFLGGDYKIMPGWHLLNYGCKYLLGEFFFVKLIQAVFLNSAVFHFIKREAKMPFVALFLYAFVIYFVLNFNILRQSMSVGFLLFAYLAFKDGSLVKYYFFAACALFFHSSAVMLLVIPLLNLIRFNKRTTLVFASLILVATFLVFTGDYFSNIMFYLISNAPTDMSTDMQYYMMDEDRGYSNQIAASIVQMAIFVFDIIIVYYLCKGKYDNKLKVLVVLYVVMYLIQIFFPILWRNRVYFDLFFFVAISNVLNDKLQNFSKQAKLAILTACMVIYLFPTYRDYFSNNNGFRYIDQYYPYTTVFTDKLYKRTI